MTTTVRPLANHEHATARSLTVSRSQQDLVEPVASSLESMGRYPDSEPLGIFVNGALVGFMMGQLLAANDTLPTYLIWGLLEDHRYQRLGIGRSAVIQAIHHATDRGAAMVTLAYEPANTVARDLYRSAGFVETRSINADGEHEMVISITKGSIPQ